MIHAVWYKSYNKPMRKSEYPLLIHAQRAAGGGSAVMRTEANGLSRASRTKRRQPVQTVCEPETKTPLPNSAYEPYALSGYFIPSRVAPQE